MAERGANAYRKVFLESATPPRLLDELYGRLLSDCHDAAEAIRQGDLAGKGRSINHAIEIIYELTAALDRSAAPELCSNLARLYDFVIQRLTTANLRIDVQPIVEAEQVIIVLRGAFQQVNAPALTEETP